MCQLIRLLFHDGYHIEFCNPVKGGGEVALLVDWKVPEFKKLSPLVLSVDGYAFLL